MSAGRSSDGLLSAQRTLQLLELIDSSNAPEQDSLRDFAALYSASWSKCRNTIGLLLEWGLVVNTRTGLHLGDCLVSGDRHTVLSDATCRQVATALAEGWATGCARSLPHAEGLWLDSMTLPGAEKGLPLWLIEFGVATRSRIGERYWRVSVRHAPMLLRALEARNSALVPMGTCAAEFDAALNARAAAGLEAEEWVVRMEQRRLAGHALAHQIRRVSAESVGAGFDIVSFSDAHSLTHDLFIEVKSFVGEKRFYWTRNEIETAARLGERYCLYLVDRARLTSPGYSPQVIRGPHAALFESDAPGWRISTATFEFVYTGPIN